MSLGPEKCAELRVKHLEMIQSVVTRMATQSASLKNYCVTLTTAVCGFAITLHRPGAAYLALLPIAAFAFLDARFLSLERGFRNRFNETRSEPWASPPSFDLQRSKYQEDEFVSAITSWSILWFYAPLALGVIVITFLSELISGTF